MALKHCSNRQNLEYLLSLRRMTIANLEYLLSLQKVKYSLKEKAKES